MFRKNSPLFYRVQLKHLCWLTHAIVQGKQLVNELHYCWIGNKHTKHPHRQASYPAAQDGGASSLPALSGGKRPPGWHACLPPPSFYAIPLSDKVLTPILAWRHGGCLEEAQGLRKNYFLLRAGKSGARRFFPVTRLD